MVLFAVVWGLISVPFLVLATAFMVHGPSTLQANLVPSLFLWLWLLPAIYFAWCAMGGMVALWGYPVPGFALSPGSPTPGSPVTLSWNWRCRKLRPERMRITVEGFEIAADERTENGSMLQSVFWSEEFAIYAEPWGVLNGSLDLKPPHGLMHSFGTRNRGVNYRISLLAEIPHWPRLREEYWLLMAPEPPRSSETPAPDQARTPIIEPPPDGAGLELQMRGTEFRPGETLEGVVCWNLADVPAGLTVRIRWTSGGRARPVTRVVSSQTLPATAPKGNASFQFTLPEAPYSFSGEHISLQWNVEAIAALHGAEAGSSNRPFTLSSDGNTIRLH